MSLRSRLTAVSTLGTAVLMAVVSALFLVTLRAGLTGNLDTTLVTRTADVVAQLGADPAAAVATEAGNGIFVQILGADGRIIDGADILGDQALLTGDQARAAASGVQTVDRTLTLADANGASGDGPDDVRVAGVPGPGGTVVAAGASRDGVDSAVRRAGLQLLVLAVLLVLLAGGSSWLLARAALRPVESMRRQAAAMHAHDADAGIDVPAGRDEIARLALTFNDLLGRLRHAVQREQAFVADAGHELRTPLTVLQGELELAGRPGRTVDELRSTVAVAAWETDRLVRLSEDLLVLARSGELRRRRTAADLRDIVRTVVRTVAPDADARRVTVDVDHRAAVVVIAHEAGLRRAIGNIVENAVRFASPGSSVEVVIAATDTHATVTVRDHGPGFPADFLPRAFDRFTQADRTRARDRNARTAQGSGLGLAIVQSIATEHDGIVEAANHPAGGAEVTLRLPLTSGRPRISGR